MRLERFTVTEDHLKLARRMNVGWGYDEFGAPAIDPKRPYGNSDVLSDMATILGVEGDPQYDAADTTLHERLNKLHEEMATVLQIALATGRFETGDYRASKYNIDWKRVSGEGGEEG